MKNDTYNMERCIRAKERARSAGHDLARMVTRFNTAKERLATCERAELAFYQKNPDYSDREGAEARSMVWGIVAIMLLDVITLKPVASFLLNMFLGLGPGVIRFVLSLAIACIVLKIELVISSIYEEARVEAIEEGRNPFLTPQFGAVLGIALFEPLLFVGMYFSTHGNWLLKSPIGYVIGAALFAFIIAVHGSVLCSAGKIENAWSMLRLQRDKTKLEKDTHSIRQTAEKLQEKVSDKATKFAQAFSNLSMSCPQDHCTVVTDFSPEVFVLIQKYIPGFAPGGKYVLRQEPNGGDQPEDGPQDEEGTPDDDSGDGEGDGPVEETPLDLPPTPPKRGRGRPKGSRNKPKPDAA
jgi:hypothetical protein